MAVAAALMPNDECHVPPTPVPSDGSTHREQSGDWPESAHGAFSASIVRGMIASNSPPVRCRPPTKAWTFSTPVRRWAWRKTLMGNPF
jgi:hypothetical protein